MRPRAPFLTASWRDLAMLNYELDPGALAPFLPRGTELDAWSGRTFASLVGFRFLDTRVLGVAVPGHRSFEEVNLRFYVRRKAEDGWRRGVVFVKEVVPRRAIAWLARVAYNENYVALPMRHEIAASGRAVYAWRFAGRWQELRLTPAGSPAIPAEGSEEEFITEHYWGYSRQRDGCTVEYRVEHPRWLVARASEASLDCDVAAFYGPEFSAYLCGPPSSAFLAAGSEVVVRSGTPIPEGRS